MSEKAREPLSFEDAEEESEPQTSSAGGVQPPGRIGSGLRDDDGEQRDWRSAPIEDLGLSMRAYNVLRRSGLITVGLIMAKSEDELLASLIHLPGEQFGSELLSIEMPGGKVNLSTQDPASRARRLYDELREKLDEIGLISMDAPWDSARGVN